MQHNPKTLVVIASVKRERMDIPTVRTVDADVDVQVNAAKSIVKHMIANTIMDAHVMQEKSMCKEQTHTNHKLHNVEHSLANSRERFIPTR
jgi:hypothetical protein